MKARISLSCFYVGVEEKEYQGKVSKKLKVLQGDEVISITIPEKAYEEVSYIEVGKPITIDCEIGTFYDRENKRNIFYIKYIPVLQE